MPTEREFESGNASAECFNPSSQEFYVPLVNERRQATRFERNASMDFVVIWREPGEERLVEVHDESLTGLGILVDDKLDLKLGSPLRLIYAGEYLEGEVRHITKRPDQRYLIGLATRPIRPEGAE